MIRFLFIFSMVIFSMSSYADEKQAVCKILERNTAHNGAAYQAGVDAYGRAVVPADLNAAPPAQVPNVIKVPLNINLAKRMNLLVDGAKLDTPFGMLEIYQDGRVLYNDQEWGSSIATLCGQSHEVLTDKITEEKSMIGAPTESFAKEVVGDGLAAQDVIKSPERMIEVAPSVAIPPQDVNIEQIAVDPPDEEVPESDIIEGGEYREIYYNE